MARAADTWYTLQRLRQSSSKQQPCIVKRLLTPTREIRNVSLGQGLGSCTNGALRLLALGTLATGVLLVTRRGNGCLGIARHGGAAIDKFRLEEHIGVVEHAVLQRDDHKLRLVKVRPQHVANVL